MIFDTHAHYDDESFDEDRIELLNNMKEKNVEYIVNVSSDVKSLKDTLSLIEQYPYIYGTIGVHPSCVDELNEEVFAEMKKYCKHEKIVAVGEIGLDYHWNDPEKEIQKFWFDRQLQLAKEENKPVVLHSREAAKETIDFLKERNANEMKAVVHCYSYSKETAQTFLDWGYYFGIGGVVTFSNAKKLKEVVEFLPIQQILLETDCPYLAPTPFRGKRNDSTLLSHVVEEIATIKMLSVEEVMEVTSKNALRFYGIK
ncbi:MAG: TatD family hydrolase [Lachnospiraceae bacterium]